MEKKQSEWWAKMNLETGTMRISRTLIKTQEDGSNMLTTESGLSVLKRLLLAGTDGCTTNMMNLLM